MSNKRSISLIHLHTGEYIEAESITEFCEVAGYQNNEKLHISPVLDQERWSYDGWVLQDTYDAMHQEWNWVDIYGNKYCMSIYEVGKKLGITQNQDFPLVISYLLEGRRESIYGLYFESAERKFISPKNYEIKKIILKKGAKTVSGRYDYEVGAKIGAERSGINKLIHGRLEHVKGWKIKEIQVGKKSIFKDKK